MQLQCRTLQASPGHPQASGLWVKAGAFSPEHGLSFGQRYHSRLRHLCSVVQCKCDAMASRSKSITKAAVTCHEDAHIPVLVLETCDDLGDAVHHLVTEAAGRPAPKEALHSRITAVRTLPAMHLNQRQDGASTWQHCRRSGDGRCGTWCTKGRVVAHHLPLLGGCTAYQACNWICISAVVEVVVTDVDCRDVARR